MLVIIGGMIIFSIDWGGSGNDKAKVTTVKPLTDFAATDARMRMSVRGPVVSNKEHQELSITVGHDSVDAVVFSGYQEKVLKNQSFNNNFDAYSVFLSALIGAGFTSRQVGNPNINVPGTCPSGRLYTFEVIDTREDENPPESAWVSSCSSKLGTYGGSLANTRRLFENQVPDYNKFTSKTDF